MPTIQPKLVAQICHSDAQLYAVKRLRYDVFVSEKGASGHMVDHQQRIEEDRYDAHCTHLVLRDMSRPADDEIVGTYRLMTSAQAQSGFGFYSAGEYDLQPLLNYTSRVLELGRSCLHPDYRGGEGMLVLWKALAEFIEKEQIEVLFGVASFPGTDPLEYQDAFAVLADRHLAPPEIRVSAKPPNAIPLRSDPAFVADRKRAVQQMPSLLKAYLRLGAVVGQGAFVDHDFNSIDVCILLHQQAINGLRRQIYTKR